MFTNAWYVKDPLTGAIVCIRVDINGITSFVPIDTMNGDYVEIMRLVAAGELIIADAE
jgi:leucyl aminopeptidase